MTRIKKTYSNLSSLFEDDGIEDINELIRYLNHLKKGEIKEIQMTVLKNGVPVKLPMKGYKIDVHFSGIKYNKVSDEEFLNQFGINSKNEQEIYEVLKSKLNSESK